MKTRILITLFVLLSFVITPLFSSEKTSSIQKRTNFSAGSMETDTEKIMKQMKKIGYTGIFMMSGSAALSSVGIIAFIPLWSGVAYQSGMLALCYILTTSGTVFFPIGLILTIIGFSLTIQHIKWFRRRETVNHSRKSPVRVSFSVEFM